MQLEIGSLIIPKTDLHVIATSDIEPSKISEGFGIYKIPKNEAFIFLGKKKIFESEEEDGIFFVENNLIRCAIAEISACKEIEVYCVSES